MRLGKIVDVGKLALFGVILFVFYFVIFLFIDLFSIFGILQYDYLAPSIYYSALVYSMLSLILIFLVFFYARRGGVDREMIKVSLLGMVFLASPIRALFMINLGGVNAGIYLSFNLIYDVFVVGLSMFLLYRFGRTENKTAVGLGFVLLFYIYVFLIAGAVPVRDVTVSMNAFLPISYGSYLHYGFYDYLTAFYAVFLGMLGVSILLKNLKGSSLDDEIAELNKHLKSKNYAAAVRTCERLYGRMEGEDREELEVIWAYALLKTDRAEDAYKIIKDVEGENGLKGDILMAMNRLEEAKRYYELAVREGSRDYVSYINLGKIYADEGDMETAEIYFRRAWELNKKDPITWQNLTALEIVRGRHDEALKLIEEAEKHVKASPAR